MGITLDSPQVVKAEIVPLTEDNRSPWAALGGSRLNLPSTAFQVAFCEVGGHTITAYGNTPTDEVAGHKLKLTWSLADGRVYATRNVWVPDSTCDAEFSAAGNTLVMRVNRGFGDSRTGVWALPLAPVGDFKVPEEVTPVQLSNKPCLQYFVNPRGDRVAIVEAVSVSARADYTLNRFQIGYPDFKALLHSETPFDIATVKRLGFAEDGDHFPVIHSQIFKTIKLQERLKQGGSKVPPEPDTL